MNKKNKIKFKEIMKLFNCTKQTAIDIRKNIANKLKKTTEEVTKKDLLENFYLDDENNKK